MNIFKKIWSFLNKIFDDDGANIDFELIKCYMQERQKCLEEAELLLHPLKKKELLKKAELLKSMARTRVTDMYMW